MSSFHNDVAIVTGAGAGIGLEICRQLCSSGVNVILNDLNVQLAEEGSKRLEGLPGKCIPYAGDASDIEFIQSMVNLAVTSFGRITIAIANAGITHFGDFLSYSNEKFRKVMKLNLEGSFFLAQQVSKQMIQQNSGGRILFMSSVTGHQAHEKLTAYGMSKAALEMLAKGLVIELSKYAITVNTVAPGATLTERTLEDPDFEKTWAGLTPLGRAAQCEDVAKATLFLVSRDASHITGQSLVVDGGWTSISPSPYSS